MNTLLWYNEDIYKKSWSPRAYHAKALEITTQYTSSDLLPRCLAIKEIQKSNPKHLKMLAPCQRMAGAKQ